MLRTVGRWLVISAKNDPAKNANDTSKSVNSFKKAFLKSVGSDSVANSTQCKYCRIQDVVFLQSYCAN